MESEDQDSEFTVDSLYRQEFALLKGMFEDHFSAEVIAGVLEDCYGDVNLAVDTLTKIEEAPSSTVAEETSPDTPDVENNSTVVSECNSDDMATTQSLNPNAPSFASVTQATTSVARSNNRPTRHPPRSKNIMPKVDYWTDQIKNIFASYTDGNRVLIIMRGAPGCGKSYLAKVIVESTVGTTNPKNFHNHIFSADDFMVEGGKYHYDVTRLEEVHMKNQAHVYKALCVGRSPVVVDNTHMAVWEMYPYIRDGVKNGYIIEVVEPCNPWSRIPSQLAKRTVHGVPQEKIQQMLKKYEGNFSGESLIKYFRLQYPAHMKPPVKRKQPPYQKLLPPLLHIKKEKTIPKMKPDVENPQSVNNSPTSLVTENLQNFKSNNNETSKVDAKGEASNLGNQLQQKLSIADKNLDELLKVETEWDNGEGWEMSQSQTSNLPNSKENVVEKPSGDPKPQRSQINEVSNQFIEPSMLSDDWIENLPSTTSNCNKASSKKESENQGQTEIISNNNSNEDEGNTLDAVSEYYVEMPNPNYDLTETSRNEDINTSTVKGRCVHEEKHFKQLRKMFKNVSRAVLREIFDNCAGDVDWACSIVLDGIQHNNLEGLGNEQSDSEDDEELDCQCECDKPRDIKIPDTFIETLPASDNISQNESLLIKKKIKKDKILTDDTIQIKKQIENTVKISEHHYSQHYLNMRRRLDDKSPSDMASTSTNPGTSAPSTNVLDAVPSISGTVNEEYILNDEEFDDDFGDMSGSDEEMVENVPVNIGMDFVRQLDELYNRQDFEYPAGFKSELSIPTRILDELNALWIEAISNQMDKVYAQSDQMIKQDEEFARKLELELQLEAEESGHSDEGNEGAAASDPKIPTLKELMADECAFSYYERQVKEEWKSKEPQDMAAQMTRKKLYELFPGVGQDTLSEMLIAHGNSFDNTVEVLLISTGQGHFLDQTNGINKFVMHKEKENKEKILQAEQQAALSVQEYPYLLKPGEEQTEVTIDSVNEWRKKATEYLTSRDQLYRKANWYLSRKRLSEATYYSQLGALHTAKYDTASNFAAAALMQLHSNAHPGTNIIDLHFLRVPEAETSLDLYIDERILRMRSAGKPKNLVVHIITGRGKHSPGRPRVKPAIIRRLQYRGLKFRQQNPGLIEARLKPSHLLLNELLNC